MHIVTCVAMKLDITTSMVVYIIKESYMMKRVLIYCMKSLTKMEKNGNDRYNI